MSTCCCKYLHVTSIAIAGANLNLTIAPVALRNKDRKILCIGTPFPTVPVGTNPAIQVINGGVTLPVQDCIGNLVRASDVGCDRSWLVAFGNDATPHLTVLRGVKNLKQCRCGDGYVPTTSIAPQSTAKPKE